MGPRKALVECYCLCFRSDGIILFKRTLNRFTFKHLQHPTSAILRTRSLNTSLRTLYQYVAPPP